MWIFIVYANFSNGHCTITIVNAMWRIFLVFSLLFHCIVEVSHVMQVVTDIKLVMDIVRLLFEMVG